MTSIFSSCFYNPDPWEELYDPDSETYFYRHRGTGEFSRNHPNMTQVRSNHVPEQREVEPIWETERDSSGRLYWTDLETGKVKYFRPEKGTFVSEVPLRHFRVARRMQGDKGKFDSSPRKSITAIRRSNSEKKKSIVIEKKPIEKRPSVKSTKAPKREDKLVAAVDPEFQQLFGSVSPAQFDAGAFFGMGEQKPRSDIASATKTTEQSEEEEKVDIPLNGEAALAQSLISAENPMFRYGK